MTKQIELNVEGMSCGNCAKSIQANLGAISGVETVEVSLENKKVAVQFDDSQVTEASITDTIDSLGFDVQQ